jgi:hypothetical protein
MTHEEILEISAKYRRLASSTEDIEKSSKYERFADFIEDNDYIFEDNYYETEEELLESFKEAEAEIDAQWENMFSEGDEDDSITDFLT